VRPQQRHHGPVPRLPGVVGQRTAARQPGRPPSADRQW
jgi:hypothetical protein